MSSTPQSCSDSDDKHGKSLVCYLVMFIFIAIIAIIASITEPLIPDAAKYAAFVFIFIAFAAAFIVLANMIKGGAYGWPMALAWMAALLSLFVLFAFKAEEPDPRKVKIAQLEMELEVLNRLVAEREAIILKRQARKAAKAEMEEEMEEVEMSMPAPEVEKKRHPEDVEPVPEPPAPPGQWRVGYLYVV